MAVTLSGAKRRGLPSVAASNTAWPSMIPPAWRARRACPISCRMISPSSRPASFSPPSRPFIVSISAPVLARMTLGLRPLKSTRRFRAADRVELVRGVLEVRVVAARHVRPGELHRPVGVAALHQVDQEDALVQALEVAVATAVVDGEAALDGLVVTAGGDRGQALAHDGQRAREHRLGDARVAVRHDDDLEAVGHSLRRSRRVAVLPIARWSARTPDAGVGAFSGGRPRAGRLVGAAVRRVWLMISSDAIRVSAA